MFKKIGFDNSGNTDSDVDMAGARVVAISPRNAFYAVGAARGTAMVTSWNERTGKWEVSIGIDTIKLLQLEQTAMDIVAAFPIATGVVAHTFSPGQMLDALAVGPPGAIIGIESMGNKCCLQSYSSVSRWSSQWPTPEFTQIRWMYKRCVIGISPQNRLVLTDGRTIRSGVHPPVDLPESNAGRPRAMVFDVDGNMFLALDAMGKPTVVIRVTFTPQGQIKSMHALFAVSLCNVVGIYIDAYKRITLVSNGAHGPSLVYSHHTLSSAAHQFYPWTPALKFEAYWNTFTPFFRSVIWTVIMLLSGARGKASGDKCRVPPEIARLIVCSVIKEFKTTTWARRGITILD